MIRRRFRPFAALALVVLCATSCQFIQNEFFTLNKAKPKLETDGRAVQPW